MSSAAADAVRTRLPDSALPYVVDLLASLPIDLRLARPRRTRLGDHRGPTSAVPRHRISVNEDLNPYAFLTTLLHEIAHAATWERHRRRRRRLRPHGPEWKAEFERILRPFVAGDVLPHDVAAALGRAMADPAAATCSDRQLTLALARYDAVGRGGVFVETLRSGTIFRVDGGREFRLGPRVRSRFRCVERPTGREYRLHGLCRVVPLATDG
jgi:hypothetical protein